MPCVQGRPHCVQCGGTHTRLTGQIAMDDVRELLGDVRSSLADWYGVVLEDGQEPLLDAATQVVRMEPRQQEVQRRAGGVLVGVRLELRGSW